MTKSSMMNTPTQKYETHASQRKKELHAIESAMNFKDEASEILTALEATMEKKEVMLSRIVKIMEGLEKRLSITETIAENNARMLELVEGQQVLRKDLINAKAVKYRDEKHGSSMPAEASNQQQQSDGHNLCSRMPHVPISSNREFASSTVFDITISIHESSVHTGSNQPYKGLPTSVNLAQPLETFKVSLPAMICSSFFLFHLHMSNQADTHEAQMQVPGVFTTARPRSFEERFGELRNRLLILQNVDRASRNAGHRHLPTILNPYEPEAAGVYQKWYERNVTMNLAEGRVFEIDAIFECNPGCT